MVVIRVDVGRYDNDSVILSNNGIETQICVSKKDNASQYVGKDISFSKLNNEYQIKIRKPNNKK